MYEDTFIKFAILFVCMFFVYVFFQISYPFLFLHPSFESLEKVWDLKEPENTPFTNERVIRNSVSQNFYVVTYPHFLDSDIIYYLVADFDNDFFINSELKRCEIILEKQKEWDNRYISGNFIGRNDIGEELNYEYFNLDYCPERYYSAFSFSFCPQFRVKEKLYTPVSIYYSQNGKQYRKGISIVKISQNKWRMFVMLKRLVFWE